MKLVSQNSIPTQRKWPFQFALHCTYPWRFKYLQCQLDECICLHITFFCPCLVCVLYYGLDLTGLLKTGMYATAKEWCKCFLHDVVLDLGVSLWWKWVFFFFSYVPNIKMRPYEWKLIFLGTLSTECFYFMYRIIFVHISFCVMPYVCFVYMWKRC